MIAYQYYGGIEGITVVIFEMYQGRMGNFLIFFLQSIWLNLCYNALTASPYASISDISRRTYFSRASSQVNNEFFNVIKDSFFVFYFMMWCDLGFFCNPSVSYGLLSSLIKIVCQELSGKISEKKSMEESFFINAGVHPVTLS